MCPELLLYSKTGMPSSTTGLPLTNSFHPATSHHPSADVSQSKSMEVSPEIKPRSLYTSTSEHLYTRNCILPFDGVGTVVGTGTFTVTGITANGTLIPSVPEHTNVRVPASIQETTFRSPSHIVILYMAAGSIDFSHCWIPYDDPIAGD
ncbi:hypothetical protein MNV_1010023 [Candidatus Methanoperedens nitroreducens]|uniref:Uncharacterized protein n=1 Tax=Candidatus Methanoperedens nitratireducens TaxID=1392998 RepID=A0A284VI77_9EURY|nr:hypothetical protein MNV_1010023 [Candidatus Methanoperedens nitroreducens]